eukprot:5470110-Pleurochrysis_carterae.AAC.1
MRGARAPHSRLSSASSARRARKRCRQRRWCARWRRNWGGQGGWRRRSRRRWGAALCGGSGPYLGGFGAGVSGRRLASGARCCSAWPPR